MCIQRLQAESSYCSMMKHAARMIRTLKVLLQTQSADLFIVARLGISQMCRVAQVVPSPQTIRSIPGGSRIVQWQQMRGFVHGSDIKR